MGLWIYKRGEFVIAKSIIQQGRYCYETRVTKGLHKHHIFNGNGLRDWSEKEGLWVYLAYDVHRNLHDGCGLDITLKRIAQYYYEKTHSREEFMKHSDGHKNYLTTPLSDEEKEKYGIDAEALDLSIPDITLVNYPQAKDL